MRKNFINHETIGKNVKLFRKLNFVTQGELADYLKTDQVTISRIESGHRKLTLEEAVRLVKLWKIDFSELLSND